MRSLTALIAALVLASAAGCGGGDGSSSSDDDAAGRAAISKADDAAKTAARTAQTAIETYAVDHNGEYGGATVSELQRIDSSIPNSVEVEAEGTAAANTYTITATSSEGGNSFSVAREDTGKVTLSCEKPGVGGCSENGTW